MKKTFIFAAVIAVASLFASCEKEPTAIVLEDLNSKVTVAGFVTMRTWKEKDDMLQENDKTPVRNQKVTILYGMADPTDTTKTPAILFQEFEATTNGEGYYTIELPIAAGQQIDELKAQLRIYVENATAAYYKDGSDDKFITTNAWYQDSKTVKKAQAGLAYGMDLTLKPVELTSHADLIIDGVYPEP